MALAAGLGHSGEVNFLESLGLAKPKMVEPHDALPGRDNYAYEVPPAHALLGTPLQPPFPERCEVIYVAMGCFWGAEKKFWSTPGVHTTAVGYQGGSTPHPTYEETCTGRTGHTEAVQVVYDPGLVSTQEVLRVFWENHDPTSGYRQGNDVGTQYRSAIYWTSPAQEQLVLASAKAFGEVLAADGWDPITTELAPAQTRPFYYAEGYHQQYLHKVPNGYDCHSATGLELPKDW